MFRNWSRYYFHVSWFIPLFFYSKDACAWGIFTHAYFAQLLLWGIPVADPKFRNAIRKFPELLVAGAFLPDLSLFGRRAGTEGFDDTHHWEAAWSMLDMADSEEERSIALGYCSHLFVDIIAHNHFVPAHETMWRDCGMYSHAFWEWAMDEHVSSHLFQHPDTLMRRHRKTLSGYAARVFGEREEVASRSLEYLENGVRALRLARVNRICYLGALRLDPKILIGFNYYLKETAARMEQVNRILQGEAPAWNAELHCKDLARLTRERMGGFERKVLQYRVPLPRNLFVPDPS